MILSLPVLLILLVPFIAGIACLGLVIKPRLAVIARPLSQAALAFSLGTWWLYSDRLATESTELSALPFVPWLLVFHLLMTLFIDTRDDLTLSLHPGALLLTATFLCGMCYSTELGFLFLFAEAVSVTAWLTLSQEQRRSAILRTLVTFAIIGAGTLLIAADLKTGLMAAWRPLADSVIDQSEAALYAEGETESDLLLNVGILCFVFGIAWRVGFFPFQLKLSDEQSLEGIQRLTGRVASSVLLLAIVLPKIPGGESLGQMLIATFAIPTLIREVLKSGWMSDLRLQLQAWLLASAALMWLSVGQELFLISHSATLGIWLPSGLELFQIEFVSSLFSFIVLVGVIHELSRLGKSRLRREDLSGFLWTNPLPALAILVTLFSWIGLPGLIGFESRVGIIAGAFEIAGSGVESAAGYSLFGVIIASSQIVLFFLAVLTLQAFCDPNTGHRSYSKRISWRLCLLATLVAGITLRLFA